MLKIGVKNLDRKFLSELNISFMLILKYFSSILAFLKAGLIKIPNTTILH